MARILWCRGIAACLLGLLLPVGAVHAAADGGTSAIRTLLMHRFDKPEARLVVEPVVVRGGHAVAGWVQGERGGRALLLLEHGKWKLVACAGDAFKEAAELELAGITPADARSLAKSLAAAEAKLPAEQVRKLSLFEGVMRMDADGSRPPHAHGGHAGSKP